MGLTVKLSWYDKKTECIVENERSEDFGGDVTIVQALSLSTKYDVNNGRFDVEREWLTTLQPLFEHRIDLNEFNYQVSFDYKN